MKKNKHRVQEKAQLKANRKKAVKAVKAALISEFTTLISTFAEPNKKLKKLIEKAATVFSTEIDKTAKPVVETETSAIKTEESIPAVEEKKTTKSRVTKKTAKEATK